MPETNEWMEKASCQGLATSIFFPHREDNERVAIKICSNCPVKCECLEYALKHRLDHGIWGGMGVRARMRLLRQRRKKAS